MKNYLLLVILMIATISCGEPGQAAPPKTQLSFPVVLTQAVRSYYATFKPAITVRGVAFKEHAEGVYVATVDIGQPASEVLVVQRYNAEGTEEWRASELTLQIKQALNMIDQPGTRR